MGGMGIRSIYIFCLSVEYIFQDIVMSLPTFLKRRRNVQLILWTVISLVLWLTTDPDLGLYQDLPFGGSVVALITTLVTALPFLLIFHIARKVLFDYASADYNKILLRALRTPIGSGLAAISLSIMMLAIGIIIAAVAGTF